MPSGPSPELTKVTVPTLPQDLTKDPLPQDLQPEAQDELTNLYSIEYLRGNILKSKIFKFPPNLPFPEVVNLAKLYCGNNNFRFVWVESTITVMPLDMPSENKERTDFNERFLKSPR